MNLHRLFLGLTAALLCVSSVSTVIAQGPARAKYAGEFLAIGVGGRALGMGGAYAALADEVTAGYWNPAGLSRLNYPQVTLMHDERFGGLVNYDYGAFALPVTATASLAVSAIRLGVDNIQNTQNAGLDADGNPLPPGELENFERVDPSKITYFNAADWALYVSYAVQGSRKLSYGANVKVLMRDAGDGTAAGVGFDLGAQYRVSERLALGATLQDATTTFVAWSTGTNELISPTLKLGSAYFIDAFGGRLIPAFDVDVRFENRASATNAHLGGVSFDFHGGLEYDFHRLVALRMGYSDLAALNIGTGIHLPKFDIDYSFAKFDGVNELGSTHRISLTFTLQAEQFARRTAE